MNLILLSLQMIGRSKPYKPFCAAYREVKLLPMLKDTYEVHSLFEIPRSKKQFC